MKFIKKIYFLVALSLGFLNSKIPKKINFIFFKNSLFGLNLKASSQNLSEKFFKDLEDFKLFFALNKTTINLAKIDVLDSDKIKLFSLLASRHKGFWILKNNSCLKLKNLLKGLKKDIN